MTRFVGVASSCMYGEHIQVIATTKRGQAPLSMTDKADLRESWLVKHRDMRAPRTFTEKPTHAALNTKQTCDRHSEASS